MVPGGKGGVTSVSSIRLITNKHVAEWEHLPGLHGGSRVILLIILCLFSACFKYSRIQNVKRAILFYGTTEITLINCNPTGQEGVSTGQVASAPPPPPFMKFLDLLLLFPPKPLPPLISFGWKVL